MRDWLQIAFFILVVRPLLAVLIGMNVFGRTHLPQNQPFILIANHNSHLDTLALLALFPVQRLKHIRPVAAADYFKEDTPAGWFARTVLNILPIPRAGFTKSNNPLSLMCRAIENGSSLIIFPEGSRGEPEQMAEFKTGVAHLIHKYPQIPVIPVFLKGMGQNLPKGEIVLVPFFTDIMIGAPRHYEGNKETITHALEADVLALQVELNNLWYQDNETSDDDSV